MIKKAFLITLLLPTLCFGLSDAEELYEYKHYVKFLESRIDSALFDIQEAESILSNMYTQDRSNEYFCDVLNLLSSADDWLTIAPSH